MTSAAFTLRAEDLARYRVLMLRRAMAAGGIEAFDQQAAIGVTLVLGAAILVAAAFGAIAVGIALALGALFGMVAAAIFQNLRQARATRVADRDPPFLGAQTVRLGEDGVHVDGGRFRSFFAWDTVREVIEADGLVVLRVTGQNGVVVPASAFSDAASQAAFVAAARAKLND